MYKHTVFRHMIQEYKNWKKVDPKGRIEYVEGSYDTLKEAWEDMIKKAKEAEKPAKNTVLRIDRVYREIELISLTSDGKHQNGNKIVWSILKHPVTER